MNVLEVVVGEVESLERMEVGDVFVGVDIAGVSGRYDLLWRQYL